MAFFLLLVIQDINKVDAVLEAWTAAGAPEATIIEGTGLNHRRAAHIPMPYLYGSVAASVSANITLYSIVPDEETAEACLRAAEAILGDLDQSNTGIFAAWPLALVKGLKKNGGG